MFVRLAAATACALLIAGCGEKEKLDGAQTSPTETPHNPGPVPPLNVPAAAPSVALATPGAAIKAGQTFAVAWTGPGGADDYVDIVEAGHQPVGDGKSYAKVSTGNPVTLTAPAEPGSYDIRYVQDGGERTVIARATITVEK